MIGQFKQITPEEDKIIEKMQSIEKELREIKDEKFLLNREYDNYRDTGKWSKVAPILWGGLAVIFWGIFIADVVLGMLSGNILMSVALALAAMTPIIGIVMSVLFILALRKYLVENSSNEKLMAYAARNGIKNIHQMQRNVISRRDYIEKRELTLLMEKDEIQDKYDEIMKPV